MNFSSRRRIAPAILALGALLLGWCASSAAASEPEVRLGAEANLNEGAIAEYTFDDGTLADSIGNADLTAAGPAAVAIDAEQGSALRLTGAANEFASFPTGFFDGRSTMTISMDIRSERTSGNFFTFAFGQDTTKYYFLRVRGPEVRSAITKSSYQTESAVTSTVTAGQWHRYDVVFSDRSMQVYVDGIKTGENAALNTSVSDLGTNLVGYLGKSLYSADGYFQGWFDNVRVYDRALTATEILNNAGAEDQLFDISLAQPDVLRIAPIADRAAHSVVFPVKKGTDITALAPTFAATPSSTVSPASGTTVDLTNPVEYTMTTATGETVTWTMQARIVSSPVLPGLYADPNIAVFGDTYYIYATSDGYAGWGGREFYVWKSKNLVDWERSEEPFLTLAGANGNVPWATGNAWAPTIIERDGKYYFYFSGQNQSYSRKTIGVAVADSPEGPFVAQPTAMILNNESVTAWQAIDPAAFHDPVTDKWYLYWGNGRALFSELNDDMISLKPGTISQIHGLTGFSEGLFINYRSGVYHLTYSVDGTNSENYSVGYATASSAQGPWTYRGIILRKDLSLGIKGPGHHSIVNVPGTDDWYIAYHRFALENGNGTHRETTIDRLEFAPDGLMMPVQPTLESVPGQTIQIPPDVDVAVESRCVAGKVQVVVRVANNDDAPVAARVETAFGSKSIEEIRVGHSLSVTFATRVDSIAEGEATVTADAHGATVQEVMAYPARSCR